MAQWQIARDPPSSDGTAAKLTGQAGGTTELTIDITDANGKRATRSYSLAPRSACLFAYTALEVTGPELHLVDPILGSKKTLLNNQGVYDFQFSPNGQFLAYRYGENPTHPQGAHLSLLDLSDMQDRALAFQEDAVNAYAWSPDSSVLAVAVTAGGQSQLTGISVDARAGGADLTPFTPVVAEDPIESALYWIQNGFVAFYSSTIPDLFVPPGTNAIFYAALGDAAFDVPLPLTDIFYKPNLVVATAPGGLFVTSPSDKRSVFNSISISDAFEVDHQKNFLDPAGAFSARVENNALELFESTAEVTPSSPPFENSSSDPDSDCPKLLTWARDRERIACVAHVSQTTTSWGEIRIFDAGSATPLELAPSIVQGPCLKDTSGVPLQEQCSQSEYDYDEGSSAALPRLLSASGDWLAFVSSARLGNGAAGSLYWANLNTRPIRPSKRYPAAPPQAGAPVALAFSPSERYLLFQDGNQLSAHLLSAVSEGGDSDIESDLNAPTTAPCSDDFVTAPTRWCGGANGGPSFTWSPDKDFDVFAYRKRDQLIVVELDEPDFVSQSFVATPCDETCTGQYAFQPPTH